MNRTYKYLLRPMLGILVFVCCLLLLLHTSWGLNIVAQTVLGRLQLFDHAQLVVDEVGGRPFSRLDLRGVQLLSSNDSTLVDIERASVGYQLWPMLQGAFHFSDVEIENPQVTMRQQKNGSWDLLSINDPSEDTTSSAFLLTLQGLNLTDGSITARTYAPDKDSTYRVTGLGIEISELAVAEEFTAILDLLHGKLWGPNTAKTGEPVDLALVASYANNAIALDSLSIQSRQSFVEGQGRIYLSTEDSLLYQNELKLTASPLAFDDVRLFIPGLAPGHTANVEIAIGNDDQNLTANALMRLSDGAQLAFDGTWSRTPAGNSDIDASGAIHRFNPALLVGTDVENEDAEASVLAGVLNADFTANLTGALDALSGQSEVVFYDSELASHAFDSTRIHALLNNGAMQIQLNSGIDGAALTASGSITPFADTPEYDIEGQLTGFDLQTFVEDGFTSNLNATFNVAGREFSAEESDVRLSLQLLPSVINAFNIRAAELDAYFANSTLNQSLTLSSDAGALTSAGSIVLGDKIQVDSLLINLQEFNFASLLNDSLQGTVTARTRLTGAFDSQGQTRLGLRSDIEHLNYNQFLIQSASIAGNWIDNKITAASSGNLNTGTYQLEGLVRLGADTLGYEITRGAFQNLNIGDFIEESDQTSDLSGSLFLVGQRFTPAGASSSDDAVMSISGHVELEPSVLNQQEITSSNAWVALQSDTLRLELDLEVPEGTSSIAGWINGFDHTPTYRLTKGEFNSIDVGKLAGIENFSSDLNGHCELSGRGKELATLRATAECVVNPSHLNNVAIREGHASFDVEDNAGAISSTISFEEGRFTLQGETSSRDEVPVYQFESKLDQVDIARLLGSDSTRSEINLSMAGRGTGLDPRTMSVAAKVTGENSSFQDMLFEALDVDFHLRDGLLTVDTLAAISNIARFAGSGVIAIYDESESRSSSFTLETDLLDLAPLEAVLPATSLRAESGNLRTRVFGQQGTLRLDTRARVAGFVYNTFHVGEVDVRLTGEFDNERTLQHADVTGLISAVSIPGFLFEEIDLEARYDTTRLNFDADGRLDKDRRIHFAGSLFQEANAQKLQLDLVDLNLDEDQWSLQQPASVSVGDTYVVDDFNITSGDQRIALDGIIDLAGRQNMKLEIENFKIGTVADLLGLTGLDGPITSEVELLGPANAPVITGNFEMDVITFDKPVGTLDISVDYDSLQLILDASLTQHNRQGASLKGLLPLDLTLTTPEESTTGAGLSQNVAMAGNVDFAIDADSMAIDWLLPFIDPATLDRLEGALTAHIKIAGTAQAPTLEGEGRLTNGRIRSPLLGVTYEDLQSDITLRDNLIELSNATLHSGDGYVSGNGSIELSDLTNAILNIKVTASEFLAIDTREYRATASGNMDLTGPLTEPVLNGNVTVIRADMFLDAATSSDVADLNVQLTQEDLLMLEREFGIRASSADTTTFDFLEALEMDIAILFERDVWIRSKKNPEMNIQFSGELEVSKAPFGEYIAFGAIDLIPDRSYINQFGKRFDITLGNLTFNGPATDPRLDFEALYEVPSRRNQQNAVTIYLDAEGNLDDLDLTLRSDPTMELTDILSYIATGQPASEALQLGGVGNQSLASTGAGFALNQGVGLLTGAIEGLIQDSGLELDVIQIEPLANAKGARVTAGKYVTPRIFTAVSQPIGASDSDGTTTDEEGTVITLELELIDSVLLRLLGGESVLQINLLWHHSY